jgi:hypothetical protein
MAGTASAVASNNTGTNVFLVIIGALLAKHNKYFGNDNEDARMCFATGRRQSSSWRRQKSFTKNFEQSHRTAISIALQQMCLAVETARIRCAKKYFAAALTCCLRNPVGEFTPYAPLQNDTRRV